VTVLLDEPVSASSPSGPPQPVPEENLPGLVERSFTSPFLTVLLLLFTSVTCELTKSSQWQSNCTGPEQSQHIWKITRRAAAIGHPWNCRWTVDRWEISQIILLHRNGIFWCTFVLI